MAPPVIGVLRDQVELQSSTDTLDAYGQPSRTWTTYATVWAKVMAQSGGESQQANHQYSTVQYRITIRRRTDVSATHRAVWGTKTLNFFAVFDDDAQRKHTIITAAEVTP
jgi:SPP1 family predicted phage head-tail adaptor